MMCLPVVACRLEKKQSELHGSLRTGDVSSHRLPVGQRRNGINCIAVFEWVVCLPLPIGLPAGWRRSKINSVASLE